MEQPEPRALVGRSALSIGGDLALEIFEAWRRDLDCIDALILLAITRSNVEAVLYDRALRTRFGGVGRIAPDDLRQPVSQSVVALSLRLPEALVEHRIKALAERGECEVTPDGMLITPQQVEASHRAEIIQSAYDAERRCYLRLRDVGFFTLEPLPRMEIAAEPPIRSGAAHGAKYLLRLLSTLAVSASDLVDALLLLDIMRRATPPPDHRGVGHRLGVSAPEVRRRVRALVASQVCRRDERGAPAAAEDRPWFADAAEKNLDHLFQLWAGLAEVGALADFDPDLPHG